MSYAVSQTPLIASLTIIWIFQGWNHPQSDVIGSALNPKGVSCSIKWCRKYKQSADQGHLLKKQFLITLCIHTGFCSNRNKWKPLGQENMTMYNMQWNNRKIETCLLACLLPRSYSFVTSDYIGWSMLQMNEQDLLSGFIWLTGLLQQCVVGPWYVRYSVYWMTLEQTFLLSFKVPAWLWKQLLTE